MCGQNKGRKLQTAGGGLDIESSCLLQSLKAFNYANIRTLRINLREPSNEHEPEVSVLQLYLEKSVPLLWDWGVLVVDSFPSSSVLCQIGTGILVDVM